MPSDWDSSGDSSMLLGCGKAAVIVGQLNGLEVGESFLPKQQAWTRQCGQQEWTRSLECLH